MARWPSYLGPAEKRAIKFVMGGGGGFEGTPEASTFSFYGMIDMLAAYEAYLREKNEKRKRSKK